MIERLARRRDARGQFHFASEATGRIPQDPGILLAKSHRGLHLLALDAHALELPESVLRLAYGPSLAIETVAAGEPLMEARVGLEKRHLPRVSEALRKRGAEPSMEYLGMHFCVLRFQARPASLLGLPAELGRLTAGKGSCELLLRSYA